MSWFGSKGTSDNSADAIDVENTDEASQESQPMSDESLSRSSRLGDIIQGTKSFVAAGSMVAGLANPFITIPADYQPSTVIDNQTQVSIEAPYVLKDIQPANTEFRPGPSEEQIKQEEQALEKFNKYEENNQETQIDYVLETIDEKNQEEIMNSIELSSMPESGESPVVPPVEPVPVDVDLPTEGVEVANEASGGDGNGANSGA